MTFIPSAVNALGATKAMISDEKRRKAHLEPFETQASPFHQCCGRTFRGATYLADSSHPYDAKD